MAEMQALWGEITCPVLLLYGADSWASNPGRDGRLSNFRDARVVEFANAGHWLHHDQFDRFMAESTRLPVTLRSAADLANRRRS